MKLRLIAVGALVAASSHAGAQAKPPVYDPAKLFAAPADGSAYWDKSLEAARLASTGRLEEAERAYEEITRAYPIRGEPWTALGNVRTRLGKYREAADAYRIAADLVGAQGVGKPRYAQARSLVAAGDIDAALPVIEDLVFETRTTGRSRLYDDPAFAALRDNPRFLRAVGRDDAAAKLPRVAGWRRDIEYLLSEMKRIEPEFHDKPLQPDIVKQARDLADAVPTLSDEQIFVGIFRIMGSLRHGHTGLFPSVPSRIPFHQLPMQLWAFPEGIFVVSASGEASDLVGAQLVSIEGTPAFDALRRVGEVQGNESGMQVLWTGVYHLGVAEMLKGLGIAKDDNRIGLSLRAPDGRTIERTVQTIPLQNRPKLGPPPRVAAPIYLQRVAEAHWFEELPAKDAVYVQVNQIAPGNTESLPAFGLRLRTALTASKSHNVILDLRHNNGGDTWTYPELLRTLVAFTTQPGKQLYVIIGRSTYSAAANFITDLERFANPVFVGEPSSMTGNNAGDESFFVLPYSGLNGAFSSVRWQLSHPWDPRRSIVPQIPVPLTAQAYFRGEDPVLETILRRIDTQKP
ncbi:MAG TPA: hypothetical protein VE967_06820 [Gemmatimonadaceae bacterium]|nr:hypothetical protein [Gemmatimonadaceae bacterium]